MEGDFLGIKTSTFKDEEELIYINLTSINPEQRKFDQHGYSSKGEVIYQCFAAHDVDIGHKDNIEFVKDYGSSGIKKGDRFKVDFKDFAPYQGQFCYKSFEIIKIVDSRETQEIDNA